VATIKWKDPPVLLWFFIGLAAISTFVFWSLQLIQPINYSLPYSASFSALTALLAARVGLWVYSFTAEEGQKREWRHDYALTRVKEIYAPLWDETVALLERVENYDIADLRYGGPEGENLAKHGFDHVMASSLRLFVDSDVKSRLFTFHVAVGTYNKARGIAHNDAYDQSRVGAAELTGQAADQGPTGDIANLFSNNMRFAWGATDSGEDAQRAMRDRFGEMLVRARSADSKETVAAFEALRDHLFSRDTAKAMRRESQACAAAGKLVIARLEEIVRDPTAVVLEFET
jgi:hypothetical protein